MDSAVEVARIHKNAAEDIVVSLSNFARHDLVDIRVFAVWGDSDEPRATRKGVSLRVDKLPDLIDALQRIGVELEARHFAEPQP